MAETLEKILKIYLDMGSFLVGVSKIHVNSYCTLWGVMTPLPVWFLYIQKDAVHPPKKKNKQKKSHGKNYRKLKIEVHQFIPC